MSRAAVAGPTGDIGSRAGAQAALCSATVFVALLAGGCVSPPSTTSDEHRLRVVTSIGLLADLVRQIGGESVAVRSVVPDGVDPYAYEPGLRAVRDVVKADVAFSNYPMFEQQNILRTIDANLRTDVPHISLAEDSIRYAAQPIALVEDVSLDTIWLGLATQGEGADLGLTRASDVLLSATDATGPGDIYGYVTGAFGTTEIYVDSSDGFDADAGYRDDTAILPSGAHTHMSWTFTEPGVYTLTLAAHVRATSDQRPVSVGEATFTFVVGVPPSTAGRPEARVVHEGHADFTVDVDRREVGLRHDEPGGHSHGRQVVAPRTLAAEDVVIAVPARAMTQIPDDPRLRFLGEPGTTIYQLPQAVLGRTIHGEIDPHLWHDVRNTMSYVELIRDVLIDRDPVNAAGYRERAEAYLRELESLDEYVRVRLDSLPLHFTERYLVSEHDAFRYLAEAYSLEIAGFVTAHAGLEPSLADRRRLAETLRVINPRAVFADPTRHAPSSTLIQIASTHDVRVCDLYSGTLDGEVPDYVSMMRFNADSIYDCMSTRREGMP